MDTVAGIRVEQSPGDLNGEVFPAVQPVSTAAGGSLTVDGKAYRSTVSFNRPANATPYAAGDVIGGASSAIHTLSAVGPSGGFILLQSMALFIGNTAVPAGMAAFRVHLYSASPTAIADNAVFNLIAADRAAYMGFVDLSTPQDLGDTIYTQTDYIGRLVKLAAASTSLFVVIETRGGYTPESGTAYELRMSTLETGL
jgi:hypothetical protein